MSHWTDPQLGPEFVTLEPPRAQRAPRRVRLSWWYNVHMLGSVQAWLINRHLPYRWVNRLGTSKSQFL